MDGRFLIFVLCALLLNPIRSAAQQVVIDPSQIASSAANAADQIDFMADQLGELTSLTDKLSSVKKYIDDVFGEDGVGGKTISVMEDLGTLQRLTETFNQTLKSAADYSEYLKSAEKAGIGDVNQLLMYLNSSKRDAQQAVEVARRILSTMGFTKKEKKDEIEKTTDRLKESNARLQEMVDIQVGTSAAAKGFCAFVNYIDDNAGKDDYVRSLKEYGTVKGAASGTIGLVSLLIGLLAAAFTAWGYLHYLRGSTTGDSTSDLTFVRIGIAVLAAVAVLNILASTFSIRSI